VEAPLLAVASVNGLEQVNFQAPFELQPGRATVAVNLNGQPAQSVEVEVLAAQPALFTTDGARAAALHPDYRPVLTEAPARRGEVIQLYATGLGQVENPPPTGTAAPLSPLAPTLVPPVVTIGGVAAAVHFSGLAPGAVGQYQLNIEVPAGAPSGEQDVILAIGGISSRPVKLSVE
jgi:uncharacterized protein (TIGR03437 family)